jgi:hypothetical protein
MGLRILIDKFRFYKDKYEEMSCLSEGLIVEKIHFYKNFQNPQNEPFHEKCEWIHTSQQISKGYREFIGPKAN